MTPRLQPPDQGVPTTADIALKVDALIVTIQALIVALDEAIPGFAERLLDASMPCSADARAA